MLKLPFRTQLFLLGILAASLVFCVLAALEVSSVTKKSEQYLQAQLRLLPHYDLSGMDGSAIENTLLSPLLNASPMPALTYVQMLDFDGRVTLAEGGEPESLNSPASEYTSPLSGESKQHSAIRLGIDLRLMSILSLIWMELLLNALPAVVFFIIYSLLLQRQQLQITNSFRLLNKGLALVPHNQKLRAGKPGIAENRRNLQLLIISTHNYLKKMREERAILNTSTKVLAYQKNNSESILRSAPQGVLVLDETGQVTFVNQQFLRWYLLDAGQVLGKTPNDWCERQEMKSFLSRYRGSVARRAETGSVEFDPPGKPNAYLSMTAYPMYSAKTEEHLKSTLIVFSDTTSEVLAENAREEFAVAAAHELKTPLHAIGMHAEMLLSEDGEDPNLRIESANFINTEVAHIGELVRNMLSITRIEVGNLTINRKLTKLDDLLDTLILRMETNASEKNITFVKDYQRGMEPCFLDKDLLRVALNNLLSNAIKYNTDGGKVKVSVVETENKLTLTVSDTGIGISDEEKASVFDKFFRSEDSRVRNIAGHGLGLSLAKEIVELHGGTLSIESRQDQGTDFVIKLKKINVPLKEVA